MPRKAADGVRVHLILTKPQYRDMTKLSRTTGLSMSELLRRAVDTYLSKDK